MGIDPNTSERDDAMGLDLEAYMRRERLTLKDAADLIGVSSISMTRKYCLGQVLFKDPDLLDRVEAATGGLVTRFAIYQKHIRWLRAHPKRRRAV